MRPCFLSVRNSGVCSAPKPNLKRLRLHGSVRYALGPIYMVDTLTPAECRSSHLRL